MPYSKTQSKKKAPPKNNLRMLKIGGHGVGMTAFKDLMFILECLYNSA